jgi:hypothetical protein
MFRFVNTARQNLPAQSPQSLPLTRFGIVLSDLSDPSAGIRQTSTRDDLPKTRAAAVGSEFSSPESVAAGNLDCPPGNTDFGRLVASLRSPRGQDSKRPKAGIAPVSAKLLTNQTVQIEVALV